MALFFCQRDVSNQALQKHNLGGAENVALYGSKKEKINCALGRFHLFQLNSVHYEHSEHYEERDYLSLYFNVFNYANFIFTFWLSISLHS